jgi:hypothetical protein
MNSQGNSMKTTISRFLSEAVTISMLLLSLARATAHSRQAFALAGLMIGLDMHWALAAQVRLKVQAGDAPQLSVWAEQGSAIEVQVAEALTPGGVWTTVTNAVPKRQPFVFVDRAPARAILPASETLGAIPLDTSCKSTENMMRSCMIRMSNAFENAKSHHRDLSSGFFDTKFSHYYGHAYTTYR